MKNPPKPKTEEPAKLIKGIMSEIKKSNDEILKVYNKK